MGAISDKYTGATAVLTPKHNRNIEDFKLTTLYRNCMKSNNNNITNKQIPRTMFKCTEQ